MEEPHPPVGSKTPFNEWVLIAEQRAPAGDKIELLIRTRAYEIPTRGCLVQSLVVKLLPADHLTVEAMALEFVPDVYLYQEQGDALPKLLPLMRHQQVEPQRPPPPV